MPRPPRPQLAGVPVHVIQRGNNRGACFFSDIDRRFYLRCLAEAAGRRNCAIHAYVLMSNHVHLLVTPAVSGAVPAMLQDMGRRYVRVINTLHGRSGTLWEGRFKSSLVDTENYFLSCHRYIECNPVRAGLVSHPAAYPWSSHNHYASGVINPLITEHPVFAGLAPNLPERQALFRSLFSEGLDTTTLERIRHAANTGSALGSDAFFVQAEAKLGRSLRPPKRGRPTADESDAPAANSGKLL